MPLKSEHFTTPIKLVLPGIIVSLIGLTASNMIFNDPVKIRGRNSRTAWDNLRRYEKIYEENSEELTCVYGTTNGDLFYKDLIHLQEMTVENLKMLRDDKDIDKLVASIINLRIDTYTQLKKITSEFIDSLTKLSKQTFYDSIGYFKNLDEQTLLQQNFLADRIHMMLRDTFTIKNLGSELKRNYKIFENVVFFDPLTVSTDSIRQRIIGTWSMTSELDGSTMKIDKEGTGVFTFEGTEYPYTWSLNEKDGEREFSMVFKENKLEKRIYKILHCTNKILQYRSGKNGNSLLLACKS